MFLTNFLKKRLHSVIAKECRRSNVCIGKATDKLAEEAMLFLPAVT